MDKLSGLFGMLGIFALTSDREGLNWKWIAGVSGALILALLTILGTLTKGIISERDKQLCDLQASLNILVKQGAEATINQKWIMNEVERTREALRQHENTSKQRIQEQIKIYERDNGRK